MKQKHTRRRIRLPSMKAIRKGVASFYQMAKETGKKAMGSLRRITRRVTCRRR